MNCKKHHPKWGTEEHHKLRKEERDNYYGGYGKREKADKNQGGWHSGSGGGEYEQGGWWERDTYGKSTDQSTYKSEEKQPRAQVYKDPNNWYYVRLHVSEEATASIKNNNTTSNRDVTALLRGITDASWDILDMVTEA